jgi:hypothetical protein
MNLDEGLIWLFLFAAAMFICSMALLIYTAALLLHVQHKVRQMRPLEVVRDADGRRRQERI